MKKFFTIILNRMVYTLLFVTVQVTAFVVMFLWFRDKFAYFYAVCVLLSAFATLYLVNSDSNPAYKIAWVIPILLFPIFGGLLYLMFGKNRLSRREQARISEIGVHYGEAMHGAQRHLEALRAQNPEAALHAQYLWNTAAAAPYAHTQTEYLPLGEDMFAAMLRELEQAKRYIFMEYFIIEEGTMWNTLLEVLVRKAAQGVEVRVMYDDLGCLFTLPQHYDKTLEAKGLHCCVFNRFNNILTPRFNNRDHRKICVIDGVVGFTGGINLADEYINAYEKHGHWKDTGVLLRGEAVWSMTVMFLSLWNFVRKTPESFDAFKPEPALSAAVPSDGYVQPYTDTPLDGEAVGEAVYLQLINRARSYVYITTPYLIIDNEMITALRTAAQSGVDVRIITPHVADKKFVHAMTRSHYEVLLGAGVRIYEYTPGFIHAKTFVSDDAYATVGTINLDFRSLYLHFECGALLYGSKAVGQVKQDFLATLEQCEEISPESLQRQPYYKRLGLSVLRIFAPLL